ncbi:MAG: 4Fe-4S dicluster domain-containing protein [Rhodanobacteraceae bacterium]|nr:MAG: 4Fe-4S dicluster domain-containing protein [Rhodanobacteraceae bacterium]
MSTESPIQQPCSHCSECARACPEALDPEALFFALVRDDIAEAQRERLDACSECNRCVEACPSHIPLLDWLRWGRAELAEHARADALRARFLARNVRLARERNERVAARHEARPPTPSALPVQTISHAEVLAAIARGKAKRRRR